MYKTSKDIDAHVRASFAKLRGDHERNIRGYTIAKLYYNVGELKKTEQYLCLFLKVREEHDAAHKLLGNCYLRQNKLDKALQSFQRSLQLNPKQPDVLKEVCKLFLNDANFNCNKAKHWCDIAENQKIADECILSLRSKIMKSTNVDTDKFESLLLKEILAHPDDVHLRVRLIQNYMQEKKIEDAFKYIYKLQMQFKEEISESIEWYNTVWLVLTQYQSITGAKKEWEFWFIMVICLERQVYLSLMNISCDSELKELGKLLFDFDQVLYKVSKVKLNVLREFEEVFMNHYRGQLLLHVATYLFQRELISKNPTWRKAINAGLPILLLAYHTQPIGESESWIKLLDENKSAVVKYWKHERSFRCVQAGRTLLSLIIEANGNADKQLTNGGFKNLSEGWSSCDDLISHIRQICADKMWRHNIFIDVFTSSDYKLKDKTSLFVNSNQLEEPNFDLPSYADLENLEEKSQFMKSSSLKYLVYLSLGNEKLHEVRVLSLSGVPLTTKNLAHCSIESLSQLDFEAFLYASVLQAKRALEIEYLTCSNVSESRGVTYTRPFMLPFPNMLRKLCTEQQSKWWSLAMQKEKKDSHLDSSAEVRINFVVGLEAVRGVNGIKMDAMITFKLAEVFNERTRNCSKSEAAALDIRTELLLKNGLHMLKLKVKNVLEPFERYFTYANANTTAADKELNEAAEKAIVNLKIRYFKTNAYESFIEEMKGLQLPMATYLQAETFRKIEEQRNHSKQAKQSYIDKASDCLNQTLSLLKCENVDPNHPLNSIIHSEIQRLNQQSAQFLNDSQIYGTPKQNNSSTYEDAETDFYVNNRPRRQLISNFISSPQVQSENSELESLCKQMVSTLTLLKDEIVDNIKPEIISMRKDVGSLKDKIAQLENQIKKEQVSTVPLNREDQNTLEDLYMIEDLQNQFLQTQSAVSSSSAFSSVPAGPISNTHNQFNLQQPRNHTPTALHNVAAAAAAAFNTPIFNPINYYSSPYIMQSQATQGVNSIIGQRNPINLPYLDPNSGMNFNLPSISALLPQTSQDTRSGNNIYNLLTQPPPLLATQPSLNIQTAVTPSQPSLSAQTNVLQPQTIITNQQIMQPIVQSTKSANLPSTPLVSHSSTTSFLPQFGSSISSVSTTAVTSPSTTTLNKSYVNQPVEKGPPANVVITSSDPLPNPQNVSLQTQQQTLSVTIPSYHIKQTTLASSQLSSLLPPTSTAGVFSFNSNGSVFPGFGQSMNTTTVDTFAANNVQTVAAVTEPAKFDLSTFTFTSKKTQDAEKEQENVFTDVSSSSDMKNNTVEAELEYDPRPDFKPIIPLPDEIVVRTGEEDEAVMFCQRAKLFRLVEKEWKERGTGNIKILKGKDGFSRILMRRDQTHKICANHKITEQIALTPATNESKGYIWVTNDFADEKVQREKFFVRFKLEEQALQFRESFIQAQKESKEMLDKNEIVEIKEKIEKDKKVETSAEHQDGGSTFKIPEVTPYANIFPVSTSTPFGKSSIAPTGEANVNNVPTVQNSLFSQATSGVVGNTKAKENPAKLTDSPFANFSFSKTTKDTEGSPFSNLLKNNSQLNTVNIFGSSPFGTEPIADVANTVGAANTVARTEIVNANKLSLSEAEDDYIPTAQFTPVIPLPDLVEINTGEENETVLFEYRAKLLRFDKETGEWKERGLGNIKLLQDKNDATKVRLVMRREQIHKLCCNQRLYKNTQFNYAKNSKTALIWAGQDYSENELVTELLSVRFKKPETCAEFLSVIKKAQENLCNENDEVKKDAINANREKVALPANGFGDAFKPKIGSWTCGDCYVSNNDINLYCLACQKPRDGTVPKKPAEFIFSFGEKSKFTFGIPATAKLSQIDTNDTDKKKADESADLSSHTNISISSDSSVSNASDTNNVNNSDCMPGFGFGDKFKPKPGSWNCVGCYVVNESTTDYCTACENPKNDSIPKKEVIQNNPFAPSSSAPTFNFGFAAADFTTAGSTPKSTNVASFNFGSNLNTAAAQESSKLADTNNLLVDSTKIPTQLGKSTFTFNLKPSNDEVINKPTVFGGGDSGGGGDGIPPSFSLQKDTFSFTFKPKSPGKFDAYKDADGEDDAEVVENEEENNTYFTPAIPLPDKIEVKTGEEDEEVLFVHRAKLFRFIDSEWKERGLGEVKILRHKIFGKLRVIMRREQIFKICLNHNLSEDVEYLRKDDKSWLFAVNDFSEGEVTLEKFSLRFKNADIAESFMKAVKSALAGTIAPIESTDSNVQSSTTVLNDSTYNAALDISQEEKELAVKLSLPNDFFTSKSECSGCRGCEPDSFEFSIEPKESLVNEDDIKNPLLPLDMPQLRLPKAKSSIIKQSNLSGIWPQANTNMFAADNQSQTTNIFSGFGNSTGFFSTPKIDGNTPFNNGFLFGNKTTGSLFGAASADNPIFGQKPSIFDSKTTNRCTLADTTASSNNIFSKTFGSEQSPVASNVHDATSADKIDSIQQIPESLVSPRSTDTNSPGAIDKQPSVLFGSNSTNLNNALFSDLKSTKEITNPDFLNKSGNIDFASLAASAAKTAAPFGQASITGGFIGLTNQNDFSSFAKVSSKEISSDNKINETVGNDEENYDPHYDPIIALPKEITVITGEEDEEKIFGERAMLYRWNADTKEWKERGIGELKVLFHPIKKTYRLLLRREQIHKLVLNHAISSDFTIAQMNKNPKSFVWVCMNYAENNDGEYERLAIRFKKVEIAAKFEHTVTQCASAVEKREEEVVRFSNKET